MSTAHADSLSALLQYLEPAADGWRAQWHDFDLRSAFQPVLSITHQRIVGYEALLRAHGPEGDPIGPADLFALHRRADAAELDKLARCLHMANFVEQKITSGWLFLNSLPGATPGSVVDRAMVDGMCAHFGFPQERVVIEVLEQRDFSSPDFVDSRPAAGGRRFLVALDDFGAGFSNFDRVWRYRPDIVKLDRSLVVRAAAMPDSAAFIEPLVSILHHAGTMVLAEGIETEHELMVLMQADVDFVQGFWFGQPQASIRDASAATPALVRSMWRRYGAHAQASAQRQSINLGELTRIMLHGAQAFVASGDMLDAAHAVFDKSNALRVAIVNEHGEQRWPSIAGPNAGPPGRLAPLFPDAHSNWSRREYFQRAISAPGRVAVTGPHYSLSDGELCHTAAIAVERDGHIYVLCVDFPHDMELGTRRV